VLEQQADAPRVHPLLPERRLHHRDWLPERGEVRCSQVTGITKLTDIVKSMPAPNY
jgi:hypothetical protein